jgi:hypothetical protein
VKHLCSANHPEWKLLAVWHNHRGVPTIGAVKYNAILRHARADAREHGKQEATIYDLSY